MSSEKRNADDADLSDSQEAKRASSLSPIERYVNVLRQTSPSIAGRAALINWAETDSNAGYVLAASKPVTDLRSFVGTVINPTMPGITITRGNKFNISAISDGTRAISGGHLERLLINYGATLSGYTKVIYTSPVGRSSTDGIVVPAYNLISWKNVFTRQDGTSIDQDGLRVLQKGQTLTLYLPIEDVQMFIRMASLPTISLPPVLKSLSDLRKVDPDYDIRSWVSLPNVTNARKQDDLRKGHIALLDALESGFLINASTSQKVDAFVANPTFRFLSRLQIKRPFSKPLYDANRNAVKRVSLSTLTGDAQILLQDLAYDGNFYDRHLSSSMQVYVPGDYRVKAAKGHKRLGEVETMTATLLRRLVSAKESAESSAEAVTSRQITIPDAVVDAGSEQVLEFEI